jgi:hypothetical protein
VQDAWARCSEVSAWADCRFQHRQFVFDHEPYQLQAYAPVAVDEPVAECDDLGPRDIICIANGGRQTTGGFADDLEVPHHRVLEVSRPPAT